MADEFEYQLKAQEQYTLAAGAAGGVEGETYVDPSDGTVYVWDSARQGWFPKVCILTVYTNYYTSGALE